MPWSEGDGIQFWLFYKSDHLLRKGDNRRQRRQAAAREAAFRAAALEEASRHDLATLKGPVSVTLHIYGLESGGNPQLPPVVKAYLDALRGIAYDDDRQIEHLIVQQAPWDHPWMANRPSSSAREMNAAVSIDVESLESYTNRYDRAIRRSWWRRGSTPWRGNWRVGDEARLINERRRVRQRPVGGSRDLLRFLEEQKLRDGFFADLDRPGPLPDGTKAVHKVVPLPRLHSFVRARSGSMVTLELMGQRKGSGLRWEKTRDEALDEFAATRPGLPFEGFVALDIAVRGESVQGKDLDTLAHRLLVPIEQKLCVKRGTVTGYRVYTATGHPEGIQLRVIDNTRLRDLEIALSEADLNPSRLDRLERWADKYR